MSVDTDGKLEGWLTDATNRPDWTVFPVATLIAVPERGDGNRAIQRWASGPMLEGGAAVCLLATVGTDKLTDRGFGGGVEETL